MGKNEMALKKKETEKLQKKEEDEEPVEDDARKAQLDAISKDIKLPYITK